MQKTIFTAAASVAAGSLILIGAFGKQPSYANAAPDPVVAMMEGRLHKREAESIALQPGLTWYKVGYTSDGRVKECIDFMPVRSMPDEMARAMNNYEGDTSVSDVIDKGDTKVLVYSVKGRSSGYTHLIGYTTSLEWCYAEEQKTRSY